MVNDLVIIRANNKVRASGDKETINTLLPVFETPQLKKYKCKVDMWQPRRAADFAALTEYARTHYIVREYTRPEKIFWGGCGLIVSIIHGFFEALVKASNELTRFDSD